VPPLFPSIALDPARRARTSTEPAAPWVCTTSAHTQGEPAAPRVCTTSAHTQGEPAAPRVCTTSAHTQGAVSFGCNLPHPTCRTLGVQNDERAHPGCGVLRGATCRTLGVQNDERAHPGCGVLSAHTGGAVSFGVPSIAVDPARRAGSSESAAWQLCLIACGQARAYRSAVGIRSAKLVFLAGLCLATPLLAGCGSKSSTADGVASANQRLGGSWRLQSFSPSVPLDLPLQAVLSAELGQLIVTFNQGQFSAAGPGVNSSGRYEVTSASGDQLALVLYDTQGVGYHFTAQFMGKDLQFQSNDTPWTGMGSFQRA